MESVRRVFAEMDTDGSGTLTAEEIAASFGAHLSPYEVGGGSEGFEAGAGVMLDASLRMGLFE